MSNLKHRNIGPILDKTAWEGETTHFSDSGQGGIPFIGSDGNIHILPVASAGMYLACQGAGADPVFQVPSQRIDYEVVSLTNANSVAETTMYTYTVPAGTLGTTRILRLTAYGWYINTTGAGSQFDVKIKFGSTQFFHWTVTPTVGANSRSWVLTSMLSAANAAGTQIGSSRMTIRDAVADDTVAGTESYIGVAPCALISVDSTINKDLIITFQNATANANIYGQIYIVQLELL